MSRTKPHFLSAAFGVPLFLCIVPILLFFPSFLHGESASPVLQKHPAKVPSPTQLMSGGSWQGLSQAPRTCLGACSHLTEVSGCSFTTVLGKLQHRLWPLPTQFQWCFVLTASVLCSEQRVEPSWFAIPGNCWLGSQFQQHLFHSNLTTPNSLYLWISKHAEKEGASACLRCSWTSPGSSSSEQMRGNKPRMVWRTSRLESLHWGLTAREFSAHIWENSWIHIIQIKDFPLRTWINKQVITGVCASSTQLAGFLPLLDF